MKFYSNNWHKVSEMAKNGAITAITLYGPDKGMISELSDDLKNRLSLSSNVYEFNSVDVYSCLNNQTLFAEKEICRFLNVPQSIDSKTKHLLENKNVHFPLFIADDLATSSSFRKFFETEKHLAIVGCYPDEGQSVKDIIIKKIKQSSKNISSEALEYLLYYLPHDRLCIISEIEKLILYTSTKDVINRDDCEKVICNDIEAIPDKLCIYFMLGNQRGFIEELKKLEGDNIPEIWIIRCLARYLMKLVSVKIHMLNGKNIADAMARLKPLVFFKYVPQFKEVIQTRSLTNFYEILDKLVLAEIGCKTNLSSYIVIEKIYFESLKQK